MTVADRPAARRSGCRTIPTRLARPLRDHDRGAGHRHCLQRRRPGLADQGPDGLRQRGFLRRRREHDQDDSGLRFGRDRGRPERHHLRRIYGRRAGCQRNKRGPQPWQSDDRGCRERARQSGELFRWRHDLLDVRPGPRHAIGADGAALRTRLLQRHRLAVRQRHDAGHVSRPPPATFWSPRSPWATVRRAR